MFHPSSTSLGKALCRLLTLTEGRGALGSNGTEGHRLTRAPSGVRGPQRPLRRCATDRRGGTSTAGNVASEDADDGDSANTAGGDSCPEGMSISFLHLEPVNW